jgi:hypothetical protein
MLKHILEECQYCGDEYYQDESTSQNPELFCCGECEMFAEDYNRMKDEELSQKFPLRGTPSEFYD